MSSNNQKVVSILENTIFKALREYSDADSMRLASDFYIQVEPDSGELQLFDEEENLVTKVVIFDWVNSPKDDSFYQTITPLLKNVLSSAVNKGLFENNSFVKPFSISLTDDEFSVIEELLFLDDETFRLDDPLLKDLDTELDNFLSQLLSDID